MSIPESKHNRSSELYLFAILWPFAVLVYSFHKMKAVWAKNLFWIICSFMAFIHIYVPKGSELGEGADIGRYVLDLIDLYENSFISLPDVIGNVVKPDYYQAIITFLVSRFTDEGHILFLVFGIIYGYFYSRNIWIVIDRLPTKIPRYVYVLIALFFLVCPIWNVGGVRMWTALHVFCYGALHYFIKGDKFKLVFCYLSTLVHFSFLFPALLLAAFIFIPIRLKSSDKILRISLYLFLFTLFFNILDLKALGTIIERIAPSMYESNIEGYLGDEYVERIENFAETKSLFFRLSQFLNTYVVSFLIVCTYFLFRKSILNKNKRLKVLFTFSLLFGSFANIAAMAPSGGRFIIISRMFILPVLILILSNFKTKQVPDYMRYLTYSLLLPVLLFLRTGAECYGINLLIGNFFTALPMETNISFIYTLKSIFL